ncbi:MAG: YdhR family protein [Ilumatobacteraceae bacterium]
MIVAIVRFPLPSTMSAEAARASFEGSAPSYQGLPGLARKYYLRAEDGSEGGGVYLWESKEQAVSVYDDAWRARLTERFGAEPHVEYFECPVIVEPGSIDVT